MHDVGHLLGLEAGFPPEMDGCGTVDHEGIGADFLKQLGFSDTVAYLTRHHVSAKRYLCWKDPAYLNALSDASRTTLRFQGGAMNDDEARAMERDGRLDLVLKMRGFDEVAKDPALRMDSLESALQLVRRHLSAQAAGAAAPQVHTYQLSPEQLRKWQTDGMLVVKGALSAQRVAALPAMAEAVGALEPGAGPYLKHSEEVGPGRVALCRVENFCKGNVAGWGDLAFGLVQDLVAQCYGEPAVLFKDKLNFKGSGAAGFLCHQDATAYATDDLASHHVSVMVAIDACTPDNGCLQVAPGTHKDGVLKHHEGVIAPAVESALAFQNVLVEPGDIVLFDSYLPHRSDSNKTDQPRRLAYLTFNPAREGDLHEAYYAKKAEMMRSGTISINNDFAGKIVD